MKKNTYKLIAVCVIALLAITVIPSGILAQDNPDTGQALEISPPVKSLNVDPGETITTEISLRNVSNADLIVTGQINDFVAAGEGGVPKILLDEEEVEENPYSMKDWVPQLPELLLVPQEVKTFPVTIHVPSNASPGGHYGVIRFSAVAPQLQDTGVSLSTSLGTLMLVTVSGETEESLEVVEFSVNKDGQAGTLFESAPLQFVERIRNTGNTHVEPAGQVTITDMFGNKVAAVNVNLPPRNVLPSSIRRFEQPLDDSVIGNKWLFGRYTADLNLTYGTSDEAVSDSLTFWVIPYRLIGVVVVLLVIGFFIFRGTLRRYNEYIVNKARK